MSIYQLMWDERGYGKRWRKVMSCKASHSRKVTALNRIWKRML